MRKTCGHYLSWRFILRQQNGIWGQGAGIKTTKCQRGCYSRPLALEPDRGGVSPTGAVNLGPQAQHPQHLRGWQAGSCLIHEHSWHEWGSWSPKSSRNGFPQTTGHLQRSRRWHSHPRGKARLQSSPHTGSSQSSRWWSHGGRTQGTRWWRQWRRELGRHGEGCDWALPSHTKTAGSPPFTPHTHISGFPPTPTYSSHTALLPPQSEPKGLCL